VVLAMCALYRLLSFARQFSRTTDDGMGPDCARLVLRRWTVVNGAPGSDVCMNGNFVKIFGTPCSHLIIAERIPHYPALDLKTM
jgi:hypothetical protein